jgi:hypothetical protein
VKLARLWRDQGKVQQARELLAPAYGWFTIIQEALGIESDDVANYVFPKTWPADREQRARIIGAWLQTEARFLA